MMSEYIKRTYEIVGNLTEEEVLEILLTKAKDYPIEFTPIHFRDKTTLGDVVKKLHPKLIKKYKLLLEENNGKRRDED